MTEPKKIVIIAGPNGAGKTTFAKEFLPREAGCPAFINMDLIAAGLSPSEPEGVAGLRHFETVYRRLASRWVLYDNSGPAPRLLSRGENP